MNTSTDNAAAAKACYQAYVNKNRAAIESLLAEDFHFTSPLDNRIDRATYFERCWPGSQSIEAFEFVHLAADGERVFVVYEGRRTGGTRFRNTELMVIRDGLIHEVEVYFGWSLPHKARPGGFVSEARRPAQRPWLDLCFTSIGPLGRRTKNRRRGEP